VTKLEINELKKNDERAWDEYILNSEHSTFYHQIGWRNVVEKTYKHKPIYLIANENGELRGVLPLFLMRSMFFGKKLVSVPFAPYGGVCADSKIATDLLIDEAKKIVDEEDLDYLELRDFVKCNNNGLATNDLYVTFIVNLSPYPQIVWDKIKRDKRRNVGKAKDVGLKEDWNATIEDFYKVHARTMWDLGTPTHGLKFFKNCLSEFPNNAKVLTIEYEGKAICCQFLFFYKDTVIAVWGSSLDEYKVYHPDQLSNWEVIRYACEKEYTYFDFGRSLRDTGVYGYKERWGGYPKQLYYQYYLNNAKEVPNITSANPKRRKFARVWKKLPLPVTTVIGPRLRRAVP
jgi:FemAB-related protein (PEP-CTERM system-associated)